MLSGKAVLQAYGRGVLFVHSCVRRMSDDQLTAITFLLILTITNGT